MLEHLYYSAIKQKEQDSSRQITVPFQFLLSTKNKVLLNISYI